MSDTFDTLRILKEVPECRLRLLEIAREVLDEDGAIDDRLVGNRFTEVEQASAAAEAYARETSDALQSLKALIGST